MGGDDFPLWGQGYLLPMFWLEHTFGKIIDVLEWVHTSTVVTFVIVIVRSLSEKMGTKRTKAPKFFW